MPISPMTITNGCLFENAVTPLFKCLNLQSAQPVPSIEV